MAHVWPTFAGGYAIVDNIVDVGDLSFSNVNDNSSVRPVVSLKSDAINGGSGTITDSFVVG